jgi:thiamine biosynthesis lipoprotein
LINSDVGLEHRFKVMGGPASLALHSTNDTQVSFADLRDEVVSLLEAIEARYSRYRPNSIVSKINGRAGSGEFTELDGETMALLELADQLWQVSGGLFDITLGPLSQAWDFRPSGGADPTHIERALPAVGWDRVEWQDSRFHLPEYGMEIDLGGLVKEYAVDCAVRHLRASGITSGVIELAGDVGAIGSRPDGTPWRIAVQSPAEPGSLCTVQLVDSAIATSGNYARRVEYQGKQYGHLLNPKTGWPVEGPTSVSVIDSHCLTAGAVATVACLNPVMDAKKWLEHAALPWLMVSGLDQVAGPIADRMTGTP